jgi:hypothetical protein
MTEDERGLKVICDKLNTEFFENSISISRVKILPDTAKEWEQYTPPAAGFYQVSSREIVIKQSYYVKSDPKKIEKTLYHEMAHQLDVTHDLQFRLMESAYTWKRRSQALEEAASKGLSYQFLAQDYKKQAERVPELEAEIARLKEDVNRAYCFINEEVGGRYKFKIVP